MFSHLPLHCHIHLFSYNAISPWNLSFSFLLFFFSLLLPTLSLSKTQTKPKTPSKCPCNNFIIRSKPMIVQFTAYIRMVYVCSSYIPPSDQADSGSNTPKYIHTHTHIFVHRHTNAHYSNVIGEQLRISTRSRYTFNQIYFNFICLHLYVCICLCVCVWVWFIYLLSVMPCYCLIHCYFGHLNHFSILFWIYFWHTHIRSFQYYWVWF